MNYFGGLLQREIILIRSLINFKAKLHRKDCFFFMNEHDVECSNFFNVLNMVLRRVLERRAGCCNHGVSWDVLNAMQKKRDFSCPNHFISFLFCFLNLNMYFN